MTSSSGNYYEQEEHHPSLTDASYKAYFFGPFRLEHENQALGEPTWRRNKAKALLKWFLLNPGDLFSVEQLSNLFWPAVSLKVAASNLHVTLHYLRHILEPETPTGSHSTFIRRNRHNYYWFDLNDTWWIDLFDVQHLSLKAKEAERQENTVRAMNLYNQLIAYYSLTFLPEDVYEDIFAPYRRKHEYAYTQLLEHLMQLNLQNQRIDDALSCAFRALTADPYNENAVKTIVHVHLQQGNTMGALRQIDEFGDLLQHEVGIEPGADILSLRRTILDSR
ncbi:MAG TPA: BTAD domain-containing putative transcriptional regulator [Ktedonobacteraceae bacterium]|nr:BTAD domain-containing putative transcriptional regulator [Ktedonobacteraceae bacterium]